MRVQVEPGRIEVISSYIWKYIKYTENTFL